MNEKDLYALKALEAALTGSSALTGNKLALEFEQDMPGPLPGTKKKPTKPKTVKQTNDKPSEAVYVVELEKALGMLDCLAGGNLHVEPLKTNNKLKEFKKFLKEELKGVVDDAVEVALYRTFPVLVGKSYSRNGDGERSHEYRYKAHCESCEGYWWANHSKDECVEEGLACWKHTSSIQVPKAIKKVVIGETDLTSYLSEDLPYNPDGPLPDEFDLDFKVFKAYHKIYGKTIDSLYPDYAVEWFPTGGYRWGNWTGHHHMTKKGVEAKTEDKPDIWELPHPQFMKEAALKEAKHLKDLYPDYTSTFIPGEVQYLSGGHFVMTKKPGISKEEMVTKLDKIFEPGS